MLPAGTVLQGRYRIDGPLGQGGMAEVYVATHLELNVRCAIKTMQFLCAHPGESDGLRQQFKLEASLLYRLTHPHLAKVTDFFEDGAAAYTVMEYVEGVDLGTALGFPMAEDQVLSIATQIMDALDYLHSQDPPVIARDLNPRNVMVAPDGHVRLIDFGIAKVLTAGQATATIAHGTGTPGFAPPEQYGSGGTDHRSDLYALGATLLCLLTGEVPPEAIARVTDRTVLPNPHRHHLGLSERTSSVISSLMSLAPAERPASVAAVRTALGVPRTGSVSGIRGASPGQGPRFTRQLPGSPTAGFPPAGGGPAGLSQAPSHNIHVSLPAASPRNLGQNRGRMGRRWAWLLVFPLVLWLVSLTDRRPIVPPEATETPIAARTPVKAQPPLAPPRLVAIRPPAARPTPIPNPVAPRPEVHPSLGPGVGYPTKPPSVGFHPAPSPASGDSPASRIGCSGIFSDCFIIVFKTSPQGYTYAYTTQGSHYANIPAHTTITGAMLTLGEMHAGEAGLVITTDRTQALNWVIAHKTDPAYTVKPQTLVSELEFLSSRYYPG